MSELQDFIIYKISMWSNGEKRWVSHIRRCDTTKDVDDVYTFCFAMKARGHRVRLRKVD